MKTHELADALTLLAKMLKAGRNVDVKNWPGPVAVNGIPDSTDAAGLSLAMLAGLARFTKSQWRVLIDEWGIPVDVRLTDSTRDLIGRLFRFLDEHPETVHRLRTEPKKKSAKASPELLRALDILLGKNDSDQPHPAQQ